MLHTLDINKFKNVSIIKLKLCVFIKKIHLPFGKEADKEQHLSS